MRHYPTNSPQAAARIVALAMLADGHLSRIELDVLERLDVDGQLGLPRAELHRVLHLFCEDLLHSAQLSWSDVCRVEASTLAGLLAEIDDPALRNKLVKLCISVIEADAHVSDGESRLLLAAIEHWDLQLPVRPPVVSPSN